MSALWKELLVELNAVGLACIERGRDDAIEYLGLEPFINGFPDAPLAVLASKVGREELTWLGQKGATPQQIANAEERLGFRFPDSYREFLLESNGFLVPGTYCCVLLPVELVRKFGDDNAQIVAMWANAHAKDPLLDIEDVTYRMGDAIQVTAEPSDYDWFVLFDPINASPKGEPWTVMYSRQGYDCEETFLDLIQELVSSYQASFRR